MSCEIYPKKISKYLCDTNICPLCCKELSIKYENIYEKKLKEDCKKCNDNHYDSIYCFCDDSNNNYYYVSKLITCVNCNKCPKHDNNIKYRDFCKICSIFDTNKIEYVDNESLYKLSYSKLYSIATEKKIKRRSLMNKIELTEAIAKVM